MNSKSLQPFLRWAIVISASLILMSTAHAASKYKVLHYFGDRPARVPFAGVVADSAGNLYGTTQQSPPTRNCNGPLGCGTVFKLTRGSGGTWSFSVLHLFRGRPDGDFPDGNLIFDSSGNLYGTTYYGGTNDSGTVFQLSPSGKGWDEKVIYDAGTGHSAGHPTGSLTMDNAGNLYGHEVDGGTNNDGGIFQLTPSGNTWQATLIHQFDERVDGGWPDGDMVFDPAGNLYGTTILGGAAGNGMVFQLSPVSGGGWKETVLYNFTAAYDEALSLGVIIDAAGNLYGTTLGSSSCQAGCGEVYQLTPSQGGWTETVLYTFHGGDGANPSGRLLLDSGGSLNGMTYQGGPYNRGIVFKLSKSGSSWTETMLRFFSGKRGADPFGDLILDSQGVLYGTASEGGLGWKPPRTPGYGVVFSLTP